jgi:four helix bundle suffix protein
MSNDETLVPRHGGYRNLKSFQIARLIYDLTVRFCDRYVDRRSRTHDQMVQAARSGVQNIAEGSLASGTSKKTELKLTNVARASLEELRLDFEDDLRQRRIQPWPPDHPALQRFRQQRCSTLAEVGLRVRQELIRTPTEGPDLTDGHGRTRTDTDQRPGDEPEGTAGPDPAAVLAANAALSLLNLCCHLLDRRLAAQAEAFEREGGFTERLYRYRTQRRSMG